jgi:hypothetical protein
MTIMRQHADTLDDPFAAISTDIDHENNQLPCPIPIVKAGDQHIPETEATETTDTDRQDDDAPITPTAAPAVTTDCGDTGVTDSTKEKQS